MATSPAPGDGSRFVCGIDIGGTFTDCAVVDPNGRIVTAKVPSTPHQPAVAFIDALTAAAETLGMDIGTLLGRTDHVMHGTTIATNVVVQKSGAKVGLLGTVGHAEAILLMRGSGRTTGVSIEEMLDIPGSDKPEPLVPRHLIEEVVERVDSDGEIVVPLDEAQVRDAVTRLLAEGVDAIAICLLWSFLNPEPEQRVKAIVHEMAPDVYVTASSDLSPVMGEYERTVATVLNCYVGPETRGYLDDLSERIAAAGFERDVLIVQSTGGVVPVGRAGDEASLTLGSGPVAGVIGSQFLAGALEVPIPHVVAIDMGGTSFDIGLVRGGEPVMSDVATVDQYQYQVANVAVKSIGAGGGSIATVDPVSGGILVGPESAGAQPGPACYGRGGTEPTVTDADLVLGYLDPEFFLGGGMSLDRALAENAIDKVAQSAGLSREEAAAGIVKVVEFRMADLIRATTVERGYDPRDFALFVYGGAGAVHGVVLARELGISKVVVPMGNPAGVWSAVGAATSDVLSVLRMSDPQTAPFDAARLGDAFRDLEQRGRDTLLEHGFDADAVTLSRRASLRYRYQIHEVEIDVPDGEITDEVAENLVCDFAVAYERLYGKGSGFAAAGFEVTNLKLLARGRLPRLELASPTGTSIPAVGDRTRQVYDIERGEFVSAKVFKADEIGPGLSIEGPAIVELDWTTAVVQRHSRARVDELTNLIIEIEESPA